MAKDQSRHCQFLLLNPRYRRLPRLFRTDNRFDNRLCDWLRWQRPLSRASHPDKKKRKARFHINCSFAVQNLERVLLLLISLASWVPSKLKQDCGESIITPLIFFLRASTSSLHPSQSDAFMFSATWSHQPYKQHRRIVALTTRRKTEMLMHTPFGGASMGPVRRSYFSSTAQTTRDRRRFNLRHFRRPTYDYRRSTRQSCAREVGSSQVVPILFSLRMANFPVGTTLHVVRLTSTPFVFRVRAR